MSAWSAQKITFTDPFSHSYKFVTTGIGTFGGLLGSDFCESSPASGSSFLIV